MNGERVLNVYDFARYLAEFILHDIEQNDGPIESGILESPRSLSFTVLNGIAAFEEMEDEEGRGYKLEIGRARA